MLEDAAATQDTVTQLVAAIRRVIREVPGAGAVAAEFCRAHDSCDPGKPRIAWNDEEARTQLVDALVTDALNLLGRLPEEDLGPRAADAVGILALWQDRTSNRRMTPTAPTDGGASPAAPPTTGWSPPSTPMPGTSTRPSPAIRTGSRPTSPSSR